MKDGELRVELEDHISNLDGLIDGNEEDGLGSQLAGVRDFLVKLRATSVLVGERASIDAFLIDSPPVANYGVSIQDMTEPG